MKQTGVIAIVGLLVVIAAIFLFAQRDNMPTVNDEKGLEIVEPLSSPTLPAVSPSPIELGRGGNSYSDPQGLYTFLYPNEYTIDTEDPDNVRIYKRGPQARPQGEITDGVQHKHFFL